jgi:SGNH hydrolase-like domain, acetyltransferase AlgX
MNNVMNFSNLKRIGYVLPRVLVLLFALDILLRFVPLSVLGIHTAQGAVRRLPSDVVGPFIPNVDVSFPADYGDLASLANLPAMRTYRKSAFKTDSLGFGNPQPLSGAPEAILLGDSFLLPSDVPLNRTFSSQLAEIRGDSIFNAGGATPLRLGPLRDLTQRLGMRDGYVVYEFLERHLTEAPPLRTESGNSGLRSLPTRILGTRRLEEIRLPLYNFIEFSPLQAMVQRLDKSICNDVFLPNRYSQNALVRTLLNGDEMLFLASDLANTKVTGAQVSAWGNYFAWLSGELKQDRLTLVVLIIPNKLSVYEPLLSVPDNASVNEQNLRNLQNLLAESKIPVVNLLDPFRTQAAADLDDHLYIYWKDDTHWNERGMTIGAKLVADTLAAQGQTSGRTSGVSPSAYTSTK